MLNPTKLKELYYLVLEEGGKPTPQADMMYLVGQTRSNQNSVLDRVYEFSGPIGIIGYPDVEHVGYPGSDVWIPELVKRGVSEERIVGITGSFVDIGNDTTIIHTLSEMRALTRYAKQNDVHSIVLVAPRFHILRAFMSGVLALTEESPELRLHPRLGTSLDWSEESSHSQGSLRGIRTDFFVEEIIRIFTYCQQGNLPSLEEMFIYLDRYGK